VAEVEGVVAGFVYVDVEWLDELWVTRPFQGRGIGTALVGHAEGRMRTAGVACGRLSVLQVNTRAIALYRRLGWVETRPFRDARSGVWSLGMMKRFTS
jgi:ribosomal protein S18 acetylase RimI-like enzyme